MIFRRTKARPHVERHMLTDDVIPFVKIERVKSRDKTSIANACSLSLALLVTRRQFSALNALQYLSVCKPEMMQGWVECVPLRAIYTPAD